MSYSITYNFMKNSTETLPSQFIGKTSDSPVSIEAGQELTLTMWADGTFCQLPANLKVKVSGATKVSWTKNTAGTTGTLVINNATTDVIVTVTNGMRITPIETLSPLITINQSPVDPRIILTKNQMLGTVDSQQPQFYYAFCPDDQKVYVYNKSNESLATTGKFRALEEYLTFDSDTAKTKINTVISTSSAVTGLTTRVTALETKLTEPIELFGGNATGWTEE